MMMLPPRRTTLPRSPPRRRIHDYLAEKPGDVDFNDAAALHLDTECHIIRLGTIAIASNLFELFDYGNQIKARPTPSRPSSSSWPTAPRAIAHREGRKGRPLQRVPRLRSSARGRRAACARDAKNINKPLQNDLPAAVPPRRR